MTKYFYYKLKTNRFLPIFLIIISLFSFMSCGNNGTEDPDFEFNMGIVLPGPDVETAAEGYDWAKSPRLAVLMAIDEMNATEGISITKIESYNGKDAQRALSNVKALIDNDDVNGIIGAGTSTHSTAIVNDGVLVNKKTLMISPSNTSPSLTATNDYYYRTTPSDTLMAVQFAELIVTTDTAKSLVIVYRSDDTYASNLYTSIKKETQILYGANTTNIYPAPYTIKDDGTFNFGTQGISTILATAPRNSAIAIISIESENLVNIVRTLLLANIATNKIYLRLPPADLGVRVDPNNPGKVSGIKAIDVTSSPSGGEATFKTRLNAYYQSNGLVAPQSIIYSHYGYDAAVIMVLGAIKANNSASEQYKDHVLAITQSGTDKTTCSLFKSCVELLNQGMDIHYVGAAGDLAFDAYGESTKPQYDIIIYNDQGTY